MPKILIVEDEPDLVRGLQFNLEARGFDVAVATNGEAGLAAVRDQRPDLVLLDVMMPRRDGYDVCRSLRRSHPDLPIVMLTAKGREDDIVLGLKLGADDYIKKPFSVAELVARVETVLRRSAAANGRPARVAFDDVVVDFERHVASRAGAPLDLSPKEFELLRYFAARPGDVVTREALLDAVWGYTSTPNTRTIDTHIVKLRQKIEVDSREPKRLITVHGLGYKFIG